MLETTLAIVKSTLRADPTLTPAERAKILALLRIGPGKLSEPNPPKSTGVVRRAEAAQRLSRSLRAIDQLCRDGALKRVRLPGRKRCSGIAADSLDALVKSISGEAVEPKWAADMARAAEAYAARQKV